MQRYIFALVLSLFAALLPLQAQCLIQSDGKNRPAWISNAKYRPKNLQNSDVIVVSVKGQTLNEARANAEQEVRAARMNATGVWIRESGPSDIQVRYQCVGEHIEYRRGSYHLWQLVQIAKRPHIELEQIPRRELAKVETNTIGLKPFIPGMAQIHRDDNVSGALFIVGISALSVGVVTTELFRADNNAKVNTTFNVAQRQQYINNAKTLQNTRNILIAATGAIYLWNVIDGFVGGRSGMSGSRQAQIFDSDFKVIPYVDSRCAGLLLSFNFGNGVR